MHVSACICMHTHAWLLEGVERGVDAREVRGERRVAVREEPLPRAHAAAKEKKKE
jgi:hypothetical protein